MQKRSIIDVSRSSKSATEIRKPLEQGFSFLYFFIVFLLSHIIRTDAYSETCQTSKTENFARIVNWWILFTFFCKKIHLRCWTGVPNTPLTETYEHVPWKSSPSLSRNTERIRRKSFLFRPPGCYVWFRIAEIELHINISSDHNYQSGLRNLPGNLVINKTRDHLFRLCLSVAVIEV